MTHTNYNTKAWKRTFRKFARKGGKGAKAALTLRDKEGKEVSYKVYNAFRVLQV